MRPHVVTRTVILTAIPAVAQSNLSQADPATPISCPACSCPTLISDVYPDSTNGFNSTPTVDILTTSTSIDPSVTALATLPDPSETVLDPGSMLVLISSIFKAEQSAIAGVEAAASLSEAALAASNTELATKLSEVQSLANAEQTALADSKALAANLAAQAKSAADALQKEQDANANLQKQMNTEQCDVLAQGKAKIQVISDTAGLLTNLPPLFYTYRNNIRDVASDILSLQKELECASTGPGLTLACARLLVLGRNLNILDSIFVQLTNTNNGRPRFRGSVDEGKEAEARTIVSIGNQAVLLIGLFDQAAGEAKCSA